MKPERGEIMDRKWGRIVKKILHEIGQIIAFWLIIGLLFPLIDTTEPWRYYRDAGHWLLSLVSVVVTYLAQMYFDKINPRKMYYCLDICACVAELVLSIFGLMAALIWSALMDGIQSRILILIASPLIFLYLIFLFGHRGVAVYQNGKIRVFNYGVRTYRADKVDEVRLDYTGRRCTIHVVVNGQDHKFRMWAFWAKRVEKNLRAIPQKCR
jgi:hypothetical protein